MKNLIILLLLVALTWVLFNFGFTHLWAELSVSQVFEGINSLFAGLAFAGIIFTIILQRNELKLQRQELKETREQLKRSADAQERSESIMAKTAEISALSQVFEYYQTAYNATAGSLSRKRYVERMNEIKVKIECIIDDLAITPEATEINNEKEQNSQ